MGLSNFSTPAEGLLPVLVMNTILSLALLKNMVRSALSQVLGGVSANSPNLGEEEEGNPQIEGISGVIGRRRRRVSITRFESLCENRSASGSGNSENENTSGTWCCSSAMLMECSVCLCRFEAKEEVSELSCKHFFHKGCLEKWFDNQHNTCPLCRSMD